MTFKTISGSQAAQLADTPLDYEWDPTIGNRFLGANENTAPRLLDQIEKLNIHGAADVAIGAAEWCLARLQKHVPPIDGKRRLQSAWAATVDPRYSMLDEYTTEYVAPNDTWTVPEFHARSRLEHLVTHLEQGQTAKVRQTALGTTLMAEYLCGRDAAFQPWLQDMLQTRAESCPRHEDDKDYTALDTSLAKPEELVGPSREDRLAGLDPEKNPYLRPAKDMAELGFVGDPYPAKA